MNLVVVDQHGADHSYGTSKYPEVDHARWLWVLDDDSGKVVAWFGPDEWHLYRREPTHTIPA